MIYEVLSLFNTPDKFVIQPHNGLETLIIDRQTGDMSITMDSSAVSRLIVGTPPTTIYGLWGVLQLLSGPHLLIVQARRHVGNLRGHSLWRVESADILPYCRSSLHLTETAAADNEIYLQLVRESLRTPGYYFSYTTDLSRSLQSACRYAAESVDYTATPAAAAAVVDATPLCDRADDRFVWNYNSLIKLRRFPRFALPVVHGFVCVTTVPFKGRTIDYALISRRSRHRAGVRYYTRGLDENGYAANFVETEQILSVPSSAGTNQTANPNAQALFSFVQTRGSVPLIWSQYPNLLYKPAPTISQDWDKQFDAFVAHFSDQVFTRCYGNQVIVNLLDAVGKERELCAQFSRMCSLTEVTRRFDGLRYEHFDFHRECSRLRWDRLSLLLERTEPDFDSMGYFQAAPDGSPQRTQHSVFRVNCIDCLDRTNVAQCLLARRALARQLADLGYAALFANNATSSNSSESKTDPDAESLESVIKLAWSDNADELSLQYAGTGALKADFTRTGRRTKSGALRDAYFSAVRYARNNFYDGWRQDAIDLLLGNYLPERGELSPFAQGRDWKVWLLPSVLLFGLTMLTMGALLPPEHWSEQMLFSLFWCTSVVLAIFGIFYYGEDFVDRPRLGQKFSRQKRSTV
ncbi:hypothetical protein BOX15_Mlig019972g2 [Macrostomum lignano]|uniref:Uncharacterized protein n=2 Tax=Macrostomum lignano TaxID=282301 RepID=A0A267DWA9_9PLAT|nr:hypothetical protein BOX15_Mlig019972g2 [Macrostomum lignano]